MIIGKSSHPNANLVGDKLTPRSSPNSDGELSEVFRSLLKDLLGGVDGEWHQSH